MLLSKHNPRQAASSLSPFVKASLPLGSLGAEYFRLAETQAKEVANSKSNEDVNVKNDEEADERTKEKSQNKVDDNMLVSAGLKVKSLGAAADAILCSARRLENEMRQETEYWRQVLAIQSKGWPICRMPREKQTLAVRYDFAEG